MAISTPFCHTVIELPYHADVVAIQQDLRELGVCACVVAGRCQ